MSNIENVKPFEDWYLRDFTKTKRYVLETKGKHLVLISGDKGKTWKEYNVDFLTEREAKDFLNTEKQLLSEVCFNIYCEDKSFHRQNNYRLFVKELMFKTSAQHFEDLRDIRLKVESCDYDYLICNLNKCFFDSLRCETSDVLFEYIVNIDLGIDCTDGICEVISNALTLDKSRYDCVLTPTKETMKHKYDLKKLIEYVEKLESEK